MPSVPKRTPKTGSALLGHELRRLRGARRLRDIVEMTQEPPLGGLVAPLSEAGLCEVESGKTMPSLARLHALSVIYRTSMSQLMAYVTEEKIAGACPEVALPDAELQAVFVARLREQAWVEALQVAVLMERRAATERQRVTWRGNRATCLARLGMHEDALILYTECCESVDLTDRQRCMLLQAVATTHVAAGNVWGASLLAREALALAEAAELTSVERALLEYLRASVLIGRHQFLDRTDERELREAVRLLDSADAQWDPADKISRLCIALERAEALAGLGNVLVALRDAQRVDESARAIGHSITSARAKLVQFKLAMRQGRHADAVQLLEQARVLADAERDADLRFELHFRLFQALKDSRPGRATASLRACDHLFPLISIRSPLVREYERVTRARS